MPNWCENTLTVTGPKEEIARFKTDAEISSGEDKTLLSMNRLVPMPIALEGTQAPSQQPDPYLVRLYGSDNWYEWHLENWGTKWDLVDVDLYMDTPKKLAYYFESAWSPPGAFVLAVSEKYPKLKFRLKYAEPGVVFSGIYWAQNGIVKDRYHEGKYYPV